MPIYEFKCLDCSNEFELVILPKEEISPICPKCGSKKIEKKRSQQHLLDQRAFQRAKVVLRSLNV